MRNSRAILEMRQCQNRIALDRLLPRHEDDDRPNFSLNSLLLISKSGIRSGLAVSGSG